MFEIDDDDNEKEMTVGISTKYHSNTVDLWCSLIRVVNNIRTYWVINGAWEIDVDEYLMTMPPYQGGVILWSGHCPYSDYNEALNWINEQI